jgi:DNA-binding MarR family transcriptional regulator
MKPEAAARAFEELFPAIYRRFCRAVGPHEYQPTRESLAILQHLADAGPLTVTEAARHMRRSQAAMSELLQRLVRRGLLARMDDERDRRRTLVWLTPAGQAVLSEARRILSQSRLVTALRQMPARQRRVLIESVQTLLETKPDRGEGNP